MADSQVEHAAQTFSLTVEELWQPSRKATSGIYPRRQQRPTQTSEVLRALHASREPMNAGEIISWLEAQGGCDLTIKQVNATCSRLLAAGHITRPSPGLYAAPIQKDDGEVRG